MKKALLLVLGVACVCFLLANADLLSNFIKSVRGGAVVPLVAAVLLMLGRHFVQAASYEEAFAAVGHKTPFWHNVKLIFSLVFINTFCLFSGAAGVAFIIDDAHEQGCDVGQATSGAILSQIGYFAAVMMVSLMGCVTMIAAGKMNTWFLLGTLAMVATLVGLVGVFAVAYKWPFVLDKLLAVVQLIGNKLLGLFKKSLGNDWAKKTSASLVSSAHVLAHNPKGTAICVAYAAFSGMLNMACLVAVGYAFGYEQVGALVISFAIAAVLIMVSPAPQGIGVTEAAITAILTAHGCAVATAAAIALVYRGIIFWIPFCIGALMLSRTGFFKQKGDESQEKRAQDAGWISGTLLLMVAVANICLAIIPHDMRPFTTLTLWVDYGNLFSMPIMLLCSVVLIICAIGLILRLRTAWAFSLTALVLIAGAEFLFEETWTVSLAALLLIVWLFVKREAFDEPLHLRQAWRHFRNRMTKKPHTKVAGVSSGSQTKRIREATGWGQQAENGAKLRMQAQQDGMLEHASRITS